MAFELFSSVRYLLRPEEISIDDWVFRLHYRMTVLFLIGSSFIGVAKQYFGDPINCQTASGVSSKVMDDYCWIHSTFHVRSEFQGNVGCILDTELLLSSHSQISHLVAADTPDTAFYQWVPFTLIFQALMFYIPRKLWKSFEGGLMEAFGKDAKKSIIMEDESCDADAGVVTSPASEAAVMRKEAVARRYAAFFQSTLHHNNGYFIQYFTCEVLNLAIDVGNIYFTDVFLGGRFIKYGTRVLRFYSHSHAVRRDMPNPMCTAFPTVTSCTFHSVGTAAGEQKFNSLCVLSLNIINEKIYLFLWFWFFGLTALTGCHLIFRMAVFVMPCSRSILLIIRARLFRSTDLRTARRILNRCYLGDWWVLYQIGRNSNTHFFRYFLCYLDACMDRESKTGSLSRRRRRVRCRAHRDSSRNLKAAAEDNSDEDVEEEEEEDNDDGGRSSANGGTSRHSSNSNSNNGVCHRRSHHHHHHRRIGLPYV